MALEFETSLFTANPASFSGKMLSRAHLSSLRYGLGSYF